MTVVVPRGYRLGGIHCGIKRNPAKQDLSLVVTERPAAAAGVYTRNLVFAASVGRNRALTPRSDARAVVVNSGNANACTGARGDADAQRVAELTAALCDARPEQVLGLSTGVIGHYLPLAKIEAGLTALAGRLGSDDEALTSAARGMMTTDTVHKLSGRTLEVSGGTIHITGMAKGAAMIAPNMGTMLAVILTDAALSAEAAQAALSAAVEQSFNCISIDGHTSTNDSVVLLANGAAAAQPLAGRDHALFCAALDEVAAELARAIPADGEGATHLVTLDLAGCASRQAAHRLAKTVAESALVKTAIHGGDPNWGRIISALGYAGVPFDPAKVSLEINGVLLFANGAPVEFDAAAVSTSIRAQRDTHIALRFGEGQATLRFWTTDLSAEYVRLNADYTT